MSAERKDLTERGAFRHWAHDIIRYGDLDPQHHVNNVAFASFSETGRTALLRDIRPGPVDCHFVIVKLVIIFHREAKWPGTVEIGSTVAAIGRTSFTLLQGIFVGDTCIATAENVLVLVDSHSRGSTPLPDDLRQRLRGFAPAGTEG